MSLENLTFSSWVIHKINTSMILNPPVCQLRPIADQGSINGSLKKSEINLFDRTLVPTYSSLDLVRKVARVVLFELSGFAIPISIGYHTSLLAIHSFSLFFQNEEDKIKTWNKIAALAKNIFFETVDFVLFGVCMSLGLKIIYDLRKASSIRSIPLRIFSCIFGAGLGLYPITYEGVRRMSMNNPSGSSIEARKLTGNFNNYNNRIDPDNSYCYKKSLFLRNQFGVVESNNGLLSYDPKEDQDIGFFEDQNLPFVFDSTKTLISPQEAVKGLLEGKSVKYKPIGYFSGIYIEQRRKKITDFISLILDVNDFPPTLGLLFTDYILNSLKKESVSFTDPLIKEKLTEIIENNKEYLGISSNKIEDLKKRIESLEDNATLITDFIEEAYRTCYVEKHVLFRTKTIEFSKIGSLEVTINSNPLK